MRTLQSATEPHSPTMTVEAAADYIGIGRTTAYSEAQRYRDSGGAAGLPNIKLGGRVLVLKTLLNELLRRGDHFLGTEIRMRCRHRVVRASVALFGLSTITEFPGAAITEFRGRL
jgi:hypothetical protein